MGAWAPTAPIAATCVALSGTISVASDLTIVEAKAEIVAAKTVFWKDPDSVRDASISPPTACPYTDRTPDIRCVCVIVNARNSFGGYTGLSASMIYFRDKKPIKIVGDVNEFRKSFCAEPFSPFPELSTR